MHYVLWNMDDILFMQAMKITRFRKCILCFIEYERHFIYASDGNNKIQKVYTIL